MKYSIACKQMVTVPKELVSLASAPYKEALNLHVALLKHKLTGQHPEPVFIPAASQYGQNDRGLLFVSTARLKLPLTP